MAARITWTLCCLNEIMKSKTRLSVLLFLLVFEILLLYSYVALGWNETTAILYWLRAVAIALIPLAIAGICIWRGGRSFSIRALLISIAGIACFLAIALLPLLEARQNRQVTSMLLASGAGLETTSFSDRLLRSLGHNMISDENVSGVPRWLQPIAGDLLETPQDKSVQEIAINSNEQMRLLLENRERFPSLATVILYGQGLPKISGVNSSQVSSFCKSASDFQGLKIVCFVNADIPDDCSFNFAGIQYLSFRGIFPPQSGKPQRQLSSEQLAAIGNITTLEILNFNNYKISDQDLSRIQPSDSLKQISFLNSDVTVSGINEFRNTHLSCEVQAE